MPAISLPPETYCAHAQGDPLHAPYHDEAYGFPLPDDNALFGRLLLEINQAGLSWSTILKKQDSLRRAYADFDPARVAAFDDADRARLLADPGVIRNRLKVEAAIHNARVILELQADAGSFHAWLEAQHPLERKDWVRLFRRHFRFTGGEITGEFLMSTGWLPGAHHPACPVYREVVSAGAPWTRSAPPGGWGPQPWEAR